MTDTDMLVRAAAIAELTFITPAEGYDGSLGLVLCDSVGRPTRDWNPLVSPGDAMQLATKLEMVVDYCEGKVWHGQIEVDFEAQIPWIEAACHAITKTAATIHLDKEHEM